MDEFLLCWTDSPAFIRSCRGFIKTLNSAQLYTESISQAFIPNSSCGRIDWFCPARSLCRADISQALLGTCWCSAGISPADQSCEAQRACAQPTGTSKELLICQLPCSAGQGMARSCTLVCRGMPEGRMCLCAQGCFINVPDNQARAWQEALRWEAAPYQQPLMPTWGCSEELLLLFSWVKRQPFSYLCCKQTFRWSAGVQDFKFDQIARKHPL